MSKLADRLKAIGQTAGRPMGFAPAAARTQPLALVLLAQAERADAKAAVADGAEGVLAASGALTASAEPAFWGVALETATKETVEQLGKDGCSFAVLNSAALPAALLDTETVDLVLQIDPDWTDMLLRGVGELSIAGVLYRAGDSGEFTIEQLLQLQRVAGLTRKPMFVAASPDMNPATVRTLRDAGVAGVVVAPGAVKAFYEAIRALPPPRRSKDRSEALLPMGLYTGSKSEPEEDEPEGV